MRNQIACKWYGAAMFGIRTLKPLVLPGLSCSGRVEYEIANFTRHAFDASQLVAPVLDTTLTKESVQEAYL